MKAATDSYPVISGVEPGSSAASAGVLAGDKVVSVNGVVPRGILEWQKLVDSDDIELMLLRGNESIDVFVQPWRELLLGCLFRVLFLIAFIHAITIASFASSINCPRECVAVCI